MWWYFLKRSFPFSLCSCSRRECWHIDYLEHSPSSIVWYPVLVRPALPEDNSVNSSSACLIGLLWGPSLLTWLYRALTPRGNSLWSLISFTFLSFLAINPRYFQIVVFHEKVFWSLEPFWKFFFLGVGSLSRPVRNFWKFTRGVKSWSTDALCAKMVWKLQTIYLSIVQFRETFAN